MVVLLPGRDAVKTPLGLLALTLAGAALVIGRIRKVTWQQLFTLLFPIMILAVSMTSRIDAGVRHILPIYPFAAVLAGVAVVEAVRWRRGVGLFAIGLAVTIFAESWQAHPDYLSHFNALAGKHPETILAESDLDLGQDLHRLSLRMKELHADHLAIAYFGSAPLERAGLPPLSCHRSRRFAARLRSRQFALSVFEQRQGRRPPVDQEI